MAAGMQLGQQDQCAAGISTNPWSDPKLTLGGAMDLRIQDARQKVERLCIQKAKLEVMDWLKLPYREVQDLLQIHDPF